VIVPADDQARQDAAAALEAARQQAASDLAAANAALAQLQATVAQSGAGQ
jgi:hypothetical protein